MLVRSAVGALVQYGQLPRPAAFGSLGDPEIERNCVLSGGDDYELVFTAPQAHRAEIEALVVELGLPLTRVGFIQKGDPKLTLLDPSGAVMATATGFDHFAEGGTGEP